MTFHQFLKILSVRKYSLVFIFSLTVVTTVAITSVLPKTYKATASVIVNFTGEDIVTGERTGVQMNTQISIIQSKNVALKVVKSLELYSDPQYIERFYKKNKGSDQLDEFIAQELMGGLKVAAHGRSNVVNISYETSSPAFAKAVANAYVDAYIEAILELNNDPTQRAVVWFQKQVAELNDNLSKKNAELINLQKESGLVELDGNFDETSALLTAVNTNLSKVRSELFNVNHKLASIKKDLSNFNDVVKDKNVELIRADVLKADVEFRQVASGVSKNHPDYKSLSSKLISLRSLYNREVRLAHVSLVSLRKSLSIKERELQTEKSRLKELVLMTKGDVQRLTALKKEVTAASYSVDVAVKRLNEMALKGKLNESEISVLNLATEPNKHSKPNLLKNTILGILLGGFLALGITVLRELLNRRVRIEDDISVSVGIPVLCSLVDAHAKR